MKATKSLKKPITYLAFFTCLAACQDPDYGQNNTVPRDNTVTQTNNKTDQEDTAAVAFSIPKEAMGARRTGRTKKAD